MEITELLQRVHTGDRGALDVVIPMVYDELKKLAGSHLRREGGGDSMQTTALVHEAFLKLAGGKHPTYENRSHFYGIASRLMRQILVDMARSRAAQKRSAAEELPLDDVPNWSATPDKSVLAVDEALHQLERVDPLKAQIVEMRYFAGMTAEESAVALSMQVHLVRRELRLAQAWLQKEMAS